MDIFNNAIMISINLLREGVPTSPRLRSRYYWRTLEEGDGLWELKSGTPLPVQRVARLFYSIFTPTQRSLHGLNDLVSGKMMSRIVSSSATDYGV